MPAFRILIASFAVIGALGVAQACAERAAGIDYDFIDRPAVCRHKSAISGHQGNRWLSRGRRTLAAGGQADFCDHPDRGRARLRRSEASSAAGGTYSIKRIPRPILMVRDAGDAIIAPFEPYALLSAATSSGSLVPSIEYVLIPNTKDPNPAPFSLRGHLFLDNREPLAETVTRWIGARHL
jgi:hypothetical protein